MVALAAYALLRDGEPAAGPAGTPAASPAAPIDESDTGSDDRSDDLRVGTEALLGDLERALRRGDVRAARALAPATSAAAQRRAGALARTVERLGVTALDLRPLAEAPATADLQRRHGAGTWVSAVQVVWRYAGTDLRPVVSAAELVIAPERGGAVLAATRPSPDGRAPSWLLEPLAVRRQGRVTVAASQPTTADRLLRLATRAVSVVGRRLPAWRGDLVLEAPGSTRTFRAVSGLSAAGARSIAAVTTTADGSTLPGSPERVYVNPRVFAPLGAAGQQIVLSHEATHVAVGDAAVGAVPVWLSEGFADWVALADSRVPVRVLASQVRGLVREGGPPRRLPGRAEFAARNPDLGAAYESAWLAVRLVASTYGEPALLELRRAAERGSVKRAFRSVLGTSLAAFTQRWRRELVRLSR